ncbi:hypothetical protein Cch01nite_32970 [Cellulomonas chitinilytica]|uniref:Uncharacterized protein n=1 Tax=Cellulomonas chitinilytica TaxID=398759 RepID=A0A919P600_9CELL|nr:hypothetical protein [Cellulomonas chitinilytica]GIG22573.1 hypothetical protein Cch01nite_32970 [Cellulomonas chitinilytica]
MTATRHRATAVVAVLVLVAAVLGAAVSGGTASASTLTVSATAPSSLVRTACTSSSLTVEPSTTASGSTTAVVVRGLTAADLGACAGLPIRVAVADASGALLADATGTVGAADPVVDVSFPTAGAALAVVVVGGFAVPASWTDAPGPAEHVVGCEVLFDDRDEVDTSRSCELTFRADGDPRDDWFSIKIDVTTTSVQPVRWRATLDFADVSRFGFVARFVGEYQGNLVVEPVAGYCGADHRFVMITGTGWRQTVSSTNPRLLDLVGNNSSPVGNPVVACP